MISKKRSMVLFIFLSIMSVMCLGLFNMPKTEVYASGSATDVRDSSYLLDISTDSPYKSTKVVGTTSGYDSYRIDHSARLTTNSNDGFEFKGWSVNYKDLAGTPQSLFIQGKIGDETVTLEKYNNVSLVSKCKDTNGDNRIDSATIDINLVFADLQIEPVYDYIYYNVDISSFMPFVDMSQMHTLSIDANTMMYYNQNIQEKVSGEVVSNKFTKAILKIDDKYFYFGDIYEDNDQFFTKHVKPVSGEYYQLIDISRGSFRLGESVVIGELKIDCANDQETVDFENDTFVDITGFSIGANGAKETLPDDSRIIIYHSEYHYTTAFSLSFNVQFDTAQINTVEYIGEELYRLTLGMNMLDRYVNAKDTQSGNNYANVYGIGSETFIVNRGAKENVVIDQYDALIERDEITTQIRAWLLSTVNIEYEFATIDADKYLVSPTEKLAISCVNYWNTVDNVSYRYYDYVCSDVFGITNSSKDIQLTEDKVINLSYTPSVYTVDYQFRLYNEDKDGEVHLSSVSGDFNINPTMYYKRNTKVVFGTAPENVGYEFKGYYDYIDEKYVGLTETTISAITPSDFTIYMGYGLIKYTLCLQDQSYDLILEYDDKQVRALNSVEITVNNDNTIRVSEGFDKEINLTQININDLINISALVNNGFLFDRFELDNGDEVLVIDADLVITEDLITKFATGTDLDKKIVINSYEEYKTDYSLEYYIDPYYNTDLSQYVEMAHLSADLTTGSSAIMTKYDVNGNVIISDIDENGDPIITQKIVIENLRLFEIVYLRSKALQLPDGQQYLFNYYTANSTSALESSFVKEGDGSNLYTREEKVSPDRSKIYVVYSLPSAMINLFTQLKDDEDKALDCADTIIGMENVAIYKDGTLLSPDASGKTYKVEFEDDISINTAEMTVELDLTNTDFGYYYSGHDFVVEGITLASSENVDQNILTITFTCTSNVIYNLNFNFKLINYLFALTIDDEDTPSINDKLTVNDMVLDFDKTEGKYVGSILYNGVAIDNATFGMNETNDSNMDLDNDKYSYTFADKSIFKDFVTRYGVSDSATSMKVSLVVVYEDYTYTVAVTFSIINAKGIDQERLMQYPLVDIAVVRDGKNVEDFETEKSGKTILYKNIPYGADISMSVDMSKMYGFKYAGWTNLNAGNNVIVGDDIGRYSADSMEIDGVVKNYNLGYTFGYIAYTLTPQYLEAEGAPRIVVNLKDSNKISRFDSLQISPMPKTERGFKFKAMYVEYKYNPDTFIEDFEKLYSVVDVNNGIFTKNTEAYEESKTYYIQLEFTGNNYQETSFDLTKYVSRGNNNIYIYFQYDMKLVSISNQYAYAGSRKLTGKGTNQAKIDVSIDDFATYTVFATSKIRPHEPTREIGDNDTVNYYDSVLVKIQINDSALERISGLHYDLRKNVTITSVSILGSNRYLSLVEDGYYELTFDMRDEIGKMSTQLDVLTINYSYQVANCTLELTTNIADENFYKNDGVSLVIYASEYGFSKNNYYNNGKVSASAKMQFLASSRFNYTLKTVGGVDYRELFRISGVNVYLEGELVPLDKYENLVYIQYEDEEKTTIEYVDLIRTLGNMKVEFIMQPIISIRNADGQYVQLTNGTYNITKVYNCDSNGVGLEQTLSIGEIASTNVDIKAADIVIGAMKLTYRDALGFITTPTQVGSYKVEISFDNSNDEFKWLQEFTGGLLSTVNLVITPRPVTVDYNSTIVEKVEKEYDSSYAYNIEDVLGYLTFEFVNNNGAKVVLPYFDAISGDYAKFSLKTDNFNEMAKITHSTDNGEVEIASADETTYYNVRIRNIELDQANIVNKNFVLTNNEVVIYNLIKINRRVLGIEGLKVNDKVNDTTTKATVDISNYRLINVVGSDNVTLLANKIDVSFVDAGEGANKKVVVNPTMALDGFHAGNYKLTTFESTATIYPYSRRCDIEGFGSLIIKNDRGLLDPQYASLIPVNADFKVELIQSGHEDYNTVRKGVAGYLSRMQVYGYGYELYFTVNGERVAVDRNLYLVAPETSRISEIIWFNGESGKVSFEDGDVDKTILIDLNQVKGDVTYLVVTEQRDLLELWQIILIISIIVFVLVVAIIVIIIVRRKKKEHYGKHEKI